MGSWNSIGAHCSADTVGYGTTQQTSHSCAFADQASSTTQPALGPGTSRLVHRSVRESCLEHDAEYQLMSWPPNSSDLNLIEHIWDVMGWQLKLQKPPIRNISDLCDRCLNIWYNLSPVIYQENLWHSCQGGLKLCCAPKVGQLGIDRWS
ncbi:transposase domain containing protein [Trichonephila clavipes]|nr:transposase domain containing protein [Trichonephila clavipes]